MPERTLVAHRLVLAEPPFSTLQGEGRYLGEPTTFVRVAGCDLSCMWCDTDYRPKLWTSVEEVVATVDAFPNRAVVVTGGEPMIHKQLPELLRGLAAGEHLVTIETNGTTRKPELDSWVRLYSISPKLPSSGNPDGIRMDALMSYVALPTDRWQFKFVVCEPADLDRIRGLLDELAVPSGACIFLQPEWSSVPFADMLTWYQDRQRVMSTWHVRLVPQVHKLVDLP